MYYLIPFWKEECEGKFIYRKEPIKLILGPQTLLPLGIQSKPSELD